MTGLRTLSRFAPLAAAVSLLSASAASAQVRISQVYGAGGLNPSQPNADYIELFNAGSDPQDLTGWSVQVCNITTTNILTTPWYWTNIPIDSGIIPPGGYFLIRANTTPGAVGTPLPTPDVVGLSSDDLVINPTGSIVVLESQPYDLPGFYCPVNIDPNLQDTVAWGVAFPCAEGGAVGPMTSGAAPFQAIHRRGGGCYETGNNPTDLIAGPPSPRNSSSPANLGSYLTSVAAPNPANAGTSTDFTVTLQTCPGGVAPTLVSVQGDFSAFGLGSAVNFTGGPSDWTYTLAIPPGQSPGEYAVNITGSDGMTTFPVSAQLSVINPLPPNDQCANAIPISPAALPMSVNVNVSGATDDSPAPGTCVPGSQLVGLKGVWYTFTAPSNGTLLWQRDDSSGLFTYSGTWINEGCGSISQFSATCATGNDWGVQLNAGDTALVQISLKSGSVPPANNLMGTFSFVTTPPLNDACPDAIDVTSQTDTPVLLTDIYAVKDFVATDGSNANCIPQIGNQGAWYRFTTTQVGVLSMNYTPGTVSSGNGMKWAVWARPSGESPASACAALGSSSNPDYCSPFAVQNIVTAPNTTYYMLIYNGNNGSGYANVTQIGQISLAFHFEPGTTPANDFCQDALDLSSTTVAPLTITVDNYLATMTGEEFIPDLATLPCAPVTSTSTFMSGVWFKYVATQNGVWRKQTLGSQNTGNVIWEVPTGTLNPCSLFTVNNLIICARSSYNSVNVRAGKTYYMYQYRNNTGGLTSPITLQNTFYPASEVPPNDTCDTAIDIATILGVPHVVDQYKAGHDIAFGCALAPDRSTSGIWYKFTPAQDCVVVAREDSLQDAGFGLWDGGTSPPPDCNAQTVDPMLPSSKIQQVGLGTPMYCMNADRLFFKAQAGHTYYILIACQFISAFPTYPFNTVFNVLPVIANEECATATTLSGTGTFDLHNVVRYASSVDNDIVAPDPNFATLSCPSTMYAVTNDTWYRWVAPASGPASFQVRAYPKPMVGGKLAFYTSGPGGSCPTSVAANLIKCLPFGTSYPDSQAVIFSPVAGQVYYIQFCSVQGSVNEPFGWIQLDINQSSSTVGRCCVGSTCLITSSVDCSARSGSYGGDGSLCATSNAISHTYAGSGGQIPDGTSTDLNSPGIFTSTINVPSSFAVADVEVNLSIAHQKYGDLRVTLTKGTTTLILSDRGRRGFTPADAATKALTGPGSYRFANSGIQSWFDLGSSGAATIPVGTYKPSAAAGVSPGLQQTFNGQNSAGAWTLRIADEFLANSGTLSAWSLTLKEGTPASCAPPGACCTSTSTCTVMSSAACATAGGSYKGDGVICQNDVGNPVTCCPANFDQVGGVSVNDLFSFLAAWFNQNGSSGSNLSADFDHSGTVSVNDLFGFLAAWFALC